MGLSKLEAPGVEGFAFIGGTGWVGVRCACGHIVSGRSLEALEGGLGDHQSSDFCPAWVAFRKAEDEDTI